MRYTERLVRAIFCSIPRKVSKMKSMCAWTYKEQPKVKQRRKYYGQQFIKKHGITYSSEDAVAECICEISDVADKVARLSRRERTIIYLYGFYGFSMEELTKHYCFNEDQMWNIIHAIFRKVSRWVNGAECPPVIWPDSFEFYFEKIF